MKRSDLKYKEGVMLFIKVFSMVSILGSIGAAIAGAYYGLRLAESAAMHPRISGFIEAAGFTIAIQSAVIFASFAFSAWVLLQQVEYARKNRALIRELRASAGPAPPKPRRGPGSDEPWPEDPWGDDDDGEPDASS